jgi:hypothetical protein
MCVVSWLITPDEKKSGEMWWNSDELIGHPTGIRQAFGPAPIWPNERVSRVCGYQLAVQEICSAGRVLPRRFPGYSVQVQAFSCHAVSDIGFPRFEPRHVIWVEEEFFVGTVAIVLVEGELLDCNVEFFGEPSVDFSRV